MRNPTIYYVTEVPPIPSTTRYQHALGIGEHTSESVLLTHDAPPPQIADVYEDVHLMTGNPARRVWQATRILNELSEDDTTVITSGQYEPTLAGYLSNQRWVADIYDDPIQGILHYPRSYHEILSRIRQRLLSYGDRRVYTLHPLHPRVDDTDGAARFTLNGAATGFLDGTINDLTAPLKFVQVGKTMTDSGLGTVLRALSNLSGAFEFDIFGESNRSLERLIDDLGLNAYVTVHGRTPHAETRSAVEDAHIGFCVLNERADWRYQYPIKIGEYMAAGTVPLLSNFTGLRQLAKTAGIYATPTVASITDCLKYISQLSNHEYRRRAKKSRAQAETIAWANERAWFAHQAIGGVAKA
jgi:glycosyltransferase involved in cell wall biosynthesis